MSGNPSIAASNKPEHIRIKTPAELTEELELRQKLHIQYRNSFFGVVHLFGPTILAAVANRNNQHDMRLTTEAEKAIIAHMVDRGPGASETSVRLNTLLELQTTLCTEYRNSYFAIINLIGVAVFGFVGDHHRQRDSVVELEAARVDDMIERIRRAAD